MLSMLFLCNVLKYTSQLDSNKLILDDGETGLENKHIHKICMKILFLSRCEAGF